jgi:hypothetical protein
MTQYTISITRPVKVSGTIVVESPTRARAIALAQEGLSRAIDELEGVALQGGRHPWVFDDEGGNDDSIRVRGETKEEQ